MAESILSLIKLNDFNFKHLKKFIIIIDSSSVNIKNAFAGLLLSGKI